MTRDDYFKLIVVENQYRLKVLNYYDIPYLEKYTEYANELKDFIDKLKVELSLSTNYIRKNILNDGTVTSANYKKCKRLIDYSKGLKYSRENAKSLYQVLSNINPKYNSLYFITIHHYHLSDLSNLYDCLLGMKQLYYNLVHTELFKSINGMFLKYELSWSLYKNTLILNPHTQIIISVSSPCRDSVIISRVKDYFSKVVLDKDKDINIKQVSMELESLKRLSNYINKDTYDFIFHSTPKQKDKDLFSIPFPDIVFILLKTKGFHFINSYKTLKIKLYSYNGS